MTFKFSLLSLEKTNECETKEIKQEKTMVKKTTNKQKSHRKKFGRAVQKCHRTTTGKKSFGKCMGKELKK